MQVQVGQLVVSAPPMFLSAIKETEESVHDKRKAMATAPLPAAPLQQIVPLETSQKRKREQSAQAAAAEADGQLVPVAPDIPFASTKKEEKVKTRHTMLGINRSLQKLLGFQWSDTVPLIPLRPIKPGEERVTYLDANGKKMMYYFNKETGDVLWQSSRAIGFDQHLRLASVMDEGSAGYSVLSALAEHCSVLPIRDSMHKLARVQELAFESTEQLTDLRRQIFLCLKLDRAPWSTSRFGRRLKEAVKIYMEDIELNDPLLAPFADGIANDVGISSTDIDAIKRSILGFADKTDKGMSSDYSKGRWDSFFDGSVVLLRLGGWFCWDH